MKHNKVVVAKEVEYVELDEPIVEVQMDVQEHPKEEKVLDDAFLAELHGRATRGALLKLENLLAFRSQPLKQFKAEGKLMQAYREAADAMMISVASLRRDMWIIRSYSAVQLADWISNGVSFDHIERANLIAEEASTTPAELLNEAVTVGADQGDKTMTVEQMTSHALGWREQPQAVYMAVQSFDKFVNAIVKLSQSLGWQPEKVSQFETELYEFKKKWFG